MATCAIPPGGRRKLFWATQPDACGTVDQCGRDCGNAGLEITRPATNCGLTCSCCGDYVKTHECPKPECQAARSISTDDWVRGLALNMLLTDARRVDNSCGWRPGSVNGHWSESYMEEGQPIGTSLRYLPTLGTIQEAVNLIRAHAEFTLNKLVAYKVALKVEVTTKYLGSGVVALDAIIYGQSGTTSKVGVTGSRLKNAWVWT